MCSPRGRARAGASEPRVTSPPRRRANRGESHEASIDPGLVRAPAPVGRGSTRARTVQVHPGRRPGDQEQAARQPGPGVGRGALEGAAHHRGVHQEDRREGERGAGGLVRRLRQGERGADGGDGLLRPGLRRDLLDHRVVGPPLQAEGPGQQGGPGEVRGPAEGDGADVAVHPGHRPGVRRSDGAAVLHLRHGHVGPPGRLRRCRPRRRTSRPSTATSWRLPRPGSSCTTRAPSSPARRGRRSRASRSTTTSVRPQHAGRRLPDQRRDQRPALGHGLGLGDRRP